MKCKYCGANISIEDEYCPYCGALNEDARQHNEDMRRYRRAFWRTRTQVMDSAGRQSRRHARAITIAALVMLNIVVLCCRGASYDLGYWWEKVQANARADSHYARLAELEADGDYQELEDYYNRYGLYNVDRLREFNAVTYAAQYYSTVYESLMRLTDPQFDDGYTTDGELAERLADNVTYFYDNITSKQISYYQEQFTPVHMAAMEDMEDRIRALLKVHCGLTDQQLDAVRDQEMSSQELMILIGRGMKIYES